jgi:predicted O-linked N-acetylglucosamine transferase (SPINDLY family)
VITLAGQRHASRIGVSLLTNAGYPEFVAQTPEAYVQRAAELAADLPRLALLRATMREQLRGSPLMDAPQFAASLEAALRNAWRQWCVTSSDLGSR